MQMQISNRNKRKIPTNNTAQERMMQVVKMRIWRLTNSLKPQKVSTFFLSTLRVLNEILFHVQCNYIIT